ncbi:MAG: MEMAR_RS02690 family S-layer glycoprotein [Methanoregula sp.]|jgi:PGF-CTERM protein|uniref:MEMAR_RS02690 family S-layer glycoprotein n=1 Tax=Methanoregula sp. TaxID=2052170 RepID=UPI003D0DD7AF
MTKRLTIALVALALFVLVAVLPVSATDYVMLTGVNQGAQVFIGEEHLNLTNALVSASNGGTLNTTIGWWASAAQIGTTTPSQVVTLANGQYQSFTVAPSTFVGYTGVWYLVNPATGSAWAGPIPVINVQDPSLTLGVWDFDQSVDVTGGSVPQGENLGFTIGTNMYGVFTNRYTDALAPVAQTQSAGYITINAIPASGTTLTALYNVSSLTNGLTKLPVATSPYRWPLNGQIPVNAWATGLVNNVNGNGQYYYPAGTYTLYAESDLNNMKANYLNGGASFTGKTISATQTVTLVSNTVKIEANMDTVVRTKPFSVTITGKPSQSYNVWVKDTTGFSNSVDSAAPFIDTNQNSVNVSDFITGAYIYQNSQQTVAQDTQDSTRYANVTLSSSGTRTVQFLTTNWTKAQQYTIRVEQDFGSAAAGHNYKYDEVTVTVQKGTVTVVAAGDQSYYLGEEILLSGTNTESATTYLLLFGPNLGTTGGMLSQPHTAIATGVTTNFDTAPVQGDNTWSFNWGTAGIELDAGTYTVYAESQAVAAGDQKNLANEAYGTVSIVIKKPFVSATASSSVIAQGDTIDITGTAEGNPTPGIAIWLIGTNFAFYTTQSVNADASFDYQLKQANTAGLAAGQYFVVVQHPMQNNRFDIVPQTASGGSITGLLSGTPVWVVNLQSTTNTGTTYNASRIFQIAGGSSLQGSDAAEALVEGITNANVDDTYTKLQFLVEVPAITINPIPDAHVGDKFTITATTNLAVGDQVLVQVYSSSFKPTDKSQSGEFSGATGTVAVAQGTNGLNTISFPVDASTFKPDEYIVQASGVLQSATGTALFNVLEGAAPTVAPTKVVTTAAPVTTVPATVAMTTVPTPVPTTKSPGYGALIALIGLGAVAFIVVRRH